MNSVNKQTRECDVKSCDKNGGEFLFGDSEDEVSVMTVSVMTVRIMTTHVCSRSWRSRGLFLSVDQFNLLTVQET